MKICKFRQRIVKEQKGAVKKAIFLLGDFFTAPLGFSLYNRELHCLQMDQGLPTSPSSNIATCYYYGTDNSGQIKHEYKQIIFCRNPQSLPVCQCF